LLARRNAPDKTWTKLRPTISAQLWMRRSGRSTSDDRAVDFRHNRSPSSSRSDHAEGTGDDCGAIGRPSPTPEARPEKKLPRAEPSFSKWKKAASLCRHFSARSALRGGSSQDVGLDLDAIGSGVAREQSPSPGAKWRRGEGDRSVCKIARPLL